MFEGTKVISRTSSDRDPKRNETKTHLLPLRLPIDLFSPATLDIAHDRPQRNVPDLGVVLSHQISSLVFVDLRERSR